MGHRTAPRIAPEALAQLARYEFPGNVRELKNVIERALIKSGGRDIGPDHLILSLARTPALPPAAAHSANGAAEPTPDRLPLNLEEAENVLIKRALAETGGNIAQAARLLGINRTRIYRKQGPRRAGLMAICRDEPRTVRVLSHLSRSRLVGRARFFERF